MDYKEHIKQSLEYIENNLKTELSLTDIARAAGYSEYHFLRIFKQVTYLTPADYIRKRRLSEVIREMEVSGRPISDIAFEYGFNSKENFTRAFKNEHNVLPTEYKSAGNSLKLFDCLGLNAVPFDITPEIVMLEGFSLTVFKNHGDYVPKFWNLYNCKKLSLKLSGNKTVEDYGISSWNNEEKRLDYFIGIQTKDASGDITGTTQIEIPSGLYAVFSTPPASHFDFVNMIHRSWEYILKVWIPQSGYSAIDGYQFESYIEASRTYSERIFIPIALRS